MKLKSLLMYGLIVTMGLFSSCKDDESPKLQFVFDGETISLEGANLFLTRSQNTYNGTHMHRDYFISDGTYTNGNDNNGWSLLDYTDATYFFAIELAVPLENDFAAGEFPLHSDWSPIDAITTNIGYVYLESGDGADFFEYYNDDDNSNNGPVSVSGGFEDGDKMTLKFNGTLTYYYFDGTNWVDNSVTGKFYYSGTVSDERAPL